MSDRDELIRQVAEFTLRTAKEAAVLAEGLDPDRTALRGIKQDDIVNRLDQLSGEARLLHRLTRAPRPLQEGPQ